MTSASNSAPHDEPDAGMTSNLGSKLCSQCQGLGLTEAHFILDPPQRTSRRVATSNFRGSHLPPGNGEVRLPKLGTMREKKDDCVICDIIWRAFERYSRTETQSAGPLKLAWEIDGRRPDEASLFDHTTRRIRVSWDETDGTQESFFLILLRSPCDHGDDCAFLGREEISPEDKLDMMKDWIKVCAEQHNSSCGGDLGGKTEFEALVKSTYFGVIDVFDMQLKALPAAEDDTGRHAEYVALSYVWGDARGSQGEHMTSRTNVMARTDKDGLKKDQKLLPKTIQDAMLLVKRIGLRYLWVDSLCIVQDSLSSWELNAKAMHLVYGNAYFTICAADGDATTGLRALSEILSNVRTSSTSASSLTLLRSHASSSSTENEIMRMNDPSNNFGDTHEPLIIEHPVRLLVSRSPEDVIRGSSWDKRGWTFQERLLSRRCLVFAEGRAYFQCRSIVMSQDKYPDPSQRGWGLDYANSTLRTLGELKKKAFWFYMKCVGLYTGRHLTKPKDILTAFQGSSWLLNQYLKAPLLYGLPRSHFDLAILWTPVSSLRRRKKRFPRGHGASSATTNWDDTCVRCSATSADFGEKDFPSWSWCGWMDGKCEYESKLLEGCLPDVQEWLTKHTWIQWYVRDRDGNLRPLWDRFMLDEDISEDKRWRGYAGYQTPLNYPIRSSALSPARDMARTADSRSASDSQSEESHGPTWVDAKIPRRRSHTTSALPATVRRRSSDVETMRPQEKSQGVYPSRPRTSQLYSAEVDRTRLPEESQEEYSPRDRAPTRYPSDVDKYRLAEEYQAEYPPHRRTRQRYSSEVDRRRLSGEFQEEYSPRARTPTRHSVEPGLEYPHSRPPPARQVPSPAPPVPEPPTDRASMESETDTGIDPYLRKRGMIPLGDQMRRTRGSSTTRSTQQSETYDIPYVDYYGRPISLSAKCGTKFSSLTPDNPFGICCEDFSDETGFDDDTAMPVLQFWTHRQDLRVEIHEQEDSNRPRNGLCKCDIRNSNDDVCGVIKLPWSYIEAHPGQGTFCFIALSDSKGFTEEEMPDWNFFTMKEREDSEWDVYFVLLLERNDHRALWERVALGKVFKAAFKGSTWSEIQLG